MLNIQQNVKTKRWANTVIWQDILGGLLPTISLSVICASPPTPISLFQLVPKDIPIQLSQHTGYENNLTGQFCGFSFPRLHSVLSLPLWL